MSKLPGIHQLIKIIPICREAGWSDDAKNFVHTLLQRVAVLKVQFEEDNANRLSPFRKDNAALEASFWQEAEQWLETALPKADS